MADRQSGFIPGVNDCCPYLGLQHDSATRSLVPDPEHRCFRDSKPRPIDEIHQSSHCLGPEHSQCAHAQERPTPGQRSGLLSRIMVGGLALVGVVTVVGLAFVAINLFPPSLLWSLGEQTPLSAPLAPATTPTTVLSASDTTPSPLATSIPTQSPTTLTPVGIATPTARATTPTDSIVTHVVAPGETLSAISRRYDVTLAAILEANDLEDQNYVWSGQTLIIPME